MFFVKCLSIFRYIFKESAWTVEPLVETKERFWRPSNAIRRSDFLGHSIDSSSKPSLASITSSCPCKYWRFQKSFQLSNSTHPSSLFLCWFRHSKNFTFLKQRGFWAFLITNIGILSPTAFAAAMPVMRTLLNFPP